MGANAANSIATSNIIKPIIYSQVGLVVQYCRTTRVIFELLCDRSWWEIHICELESIDDFIYLHMFEMEI